MIALSHAPCHKRDCKAVLPAALVLLSQDNINDALTHGRWTGKKPFAFGQMQVAAVLVDAGWKLHRSWVLLTSSGKTQADTEGRQLPALCWLRTEDRGFPPVGVNSQDAQSWDCWLVSWIWGCTQAFPAVGFVVLWVPGLLLLQEWQFYTKGKAFPHKN